MKIHLESAAGRNFIRAYAPGSITVNETVYTRSLIVTPAQVTADWPPLDFTGLQAVHFEIIVKLKPEVFILGTGARLQFPEAPLRRALIEANIGMEVMDTGAACRTYNILLGDDRQVAAALFMIE